MNQSMVVLVSGGSRGLGKAVVKDLLDHDYIVASFSRSETDFIKDLRNEQDTNREFYWQSVDIVNQRHLKDFVVSVYKKYGRLDALVNNAGVNLDQILSVTTEKEIHEILSINVEAVINLSRFASRIMLRQNRGSIINVGSILGLRGFKGTSVYSASKAALDGFTRSLARELGSRNIFVNSISPGFLDTDMTREMSESKKAQIVRRTPLGRLGKAEDVVGLVRFLLSAESSFMTGQTIVIDGGLTC